MAVVLVKWSSVHAFYSDNPSSNTSEVYNFSVKNVVEKNQIRVTRFLPQLLFTNLKICQLK